MVSQICNLDILSHEIISDLFYDDLERVIMDNFNKYKFEKNYENPKYKELPIDYAFLDFDKPVYLFGAKDTNKANKITICCLYMMKLEIPFRSIAVFNEIDNVDRFARNNLLNTATKAFSDVSGFTENGPTYFKSELDVA
jgi:hypothetical protein